MKAAGLLALTALVSGCTSAPLKGASVGQIGCPENEIEISDDSAHLGSRSWTATCRGHRFYCSAVGTGEGATTTSCKEALKPNP